MLGKPTSSFLSWRHRLDDVRGNANIDRVLLAAFVHLANGMGLVADRLLPCKFPRRPIRVPIVQNADRESWRSGGRNTHFHRNFFRRTYRNPLAAEPREPDGNPAGLFEPGLFTATGPCQVVAKKNGESPPLQEREVLAIPSFVASW